MEGKILSTFKKQASVNNFMPAKNFISTLKMQKTRVTQKTKNWANAPHQYAMQPWKQLYMFWKKPKYKTVHN